MSRTYHGMNCYICKHFDPKKSVGENCKGDEHVFCEVSLAEYDKVIKTELLDKIGNYLFHSRYASEKIADFDFDQSVTFTKAQWLQILETLKAEF